MTHQNPRLGGWWVGGLVFPCCSDLTPLQIPILKVLRKLDSEEELLGNMQLLTLRYFILNHKNRYA